MVIDDPDLCRSGLGPPEDEPPLVVDPDRMKPRAISPLEFKAVPRRHCEVGQSSGPVHLHQFSQGDPGDGGETPVLLLQEKLPRVGIGERLNHGKLAVIILSNCAVTFAAKSALISYTSQNSANAQRP